MIRSPALSQLRTLLVLSRVSNLPTVWSNCLAGWWLGGAGKVETLPLLLLGATCLYIGGMFLNDACDAGFDQQHRSSRPIPSGAISLRAVWRWSLGWLAVGALLLISLGTVTGTLTIDLLAAIVLYNALHKQWRFAPVLMALCRFLLYLVAASTGARGIGGWAIWCALALAIYVAGVSYLARRESSVSKPAVWPCLLLGAPILLALLLNAGVYREPALLLSLILGLWTFRSLRPAFFSADRIVGKTVALLLAGIVLVDWLAVVDAPRQSGFIFIPLFLLALLLQRFVPAT